MVFTPRFKMEEDITMSNDEIELLVALWNRTNASGIHLIPAIRTGAEKEMPFLKSKRPLVEDGMLV